MYKLDDKDASVEAPGIIGINRIDNLDRVVKTGWVRKPSKNAGKLKLISPNSTIRCPVLFEPAATPRCSGRGLNLEKEWGIGKLRIKKWVNDVLKLPDKLTLQVTGLHIKYVMRLLCHSEDNTE